MRALIRNSGPCSLWKLWHVTDSGEENKYEYPSAAKLTGDGQGGAWVLCANRGHDSLAVFAVDGVSGRIEFRGCTAVDGTPRAFDFDLSGRFCYSAGEKTDTIKCFAFDAVSGAMSLLQTYQTGRHPWWVEVVELPSGSL